MTQAIAVMQATAVPIAISKSKDDSLHSKDVSKAVTLAKVVKPATACRRPTTEWTPCIYCTSGITAVVLLAVARPPESIGVGNSRETSNMQQGRMLETVFFAEIREKLVTTAKNS